MDATALALRRVLWLSSAQFIAPQFCSVSELFLSVGELVDV